MKGLEELTLKLVEFILFHFFMIFCFFSLKAILTAHFSNPTWQSVRLSYQQLQYLDLLDWTKMLEFLMDIKGWVKDQLHEDLHNSRTECKILRISLKIWLCLQKISFLQMIKQWWEYFYDLEAMAETGYKILFYPLTWDKINFLSLLSCSQVQ